MSDNASTPNDNSESTGISEVLMEIRSLTAQISAVDNRLNGRLDNLDRKITDINDRVDMMGRRVIANETRPSIRVATPRTYHSATEMQSVTAPVRRRIGFYGR